MNIFTTDLIALSKWHYEHPTVTKLTRTFEITVSLGLLTLPLYTSFTIHTFSASIAGALLFTASLTSDVALNILFPPLFDMRNHTFYPGEYGENRLYYEGDVPILSLKSKDPKEAGKAHGYLCGKAICSITRRLFIIDQFNQVLPHEHRSKIINQVRKYIPGTYLSEIEGLVEGYNQWVEEQYWWRFAKKLTVEDMIYIHLFAEKTHLKPNTSSLDPFVVGCTSIVGHDLDGKLTFARNLDWSSLGVFGNYTLVIHRENSHKYLNSTVELGIAGLVGTLTGMNEHGLSLAMNVIGSGRTSEISGMPSLFYNRMCLEQCNDVDQVVSMEKKHFPLGPYHLTVADQHQAKSIHFFQSDQLRDRRRGHKQRTVIRSLKHHSPLITLNCKYTPEPKYLVMNSQTRQKNLDQFFKEKINQPLQNALSIQDVNNETTLHCVIMKPDSREFRVAFNNRFAGNAPTLHKVPTAKLFQ